MQVEHNPHKILNADEVDEDNTIAQIIISINYSKRKKHVKNNEFNIEVVPLSTMHELILKNWKTQRRKLKLSPR